MPSFLSALDSRCYVASALHPCLDLPSVTDKLGPGIVGKENPFLPYGAFG